MRTRTSRRLQSRGIAPREPSEWKSRNIAIQTSATTSGDEAACEKRPAGWWGSAKTMLHPHKHPILVDAHEPPVSSLLARYAYLAERMEKAGHVRRIPRSRGYLRRPPIHHPTLNLFPSLPLSRSHRSHHRSPRYIRSGFAGDSPVWYGSTGVLLPALYVGRLSTSLPSVPSCGTASLVTREGAHFTR